MTFIMKVKNFIFQEPQDKNVSPKVVVVLRMALLLFMLYLVCIGVGFVIMKHPYLTMFSVLFLILYAYGFYCCYQDKVSQAHVLLNINTLLWVVMFYGIFGENTGVHHFIYALILLDLLLDRKHPIGTILSLYAVRLLLYIGNFVYFNFRNF